MSVLLNSILRLMLTKHIRANKTTVLDKLELRPFCALFSGDTMGWLLRLVTTGPTGGRAPDSSRVLSD